MKMVRNLCSHFQKKFRMSKIKILIVEDELIIAMQLSDLLEELGYEVLKSVTNYDSAVECLRKGEPDFAILDIQLEGKKTGIDLAKYIKNTINIPFIFLTSNADPDTVNQAKKLNPPAYLVKPFSKDDLYTSIELALYNYQTNVPNNTQDKASPNLIVKDAFFVKSKNLFHKIKFNEITFAKSEHIYVEIHTSQGKCHLLRSSMNLFFEGLPGNFFRVHRSYIINLDFLEAINNLYVIIKGCQIPVGKNYRDLLLQNINIK